VHRLLEQPQAHHVAVIPFPLEQAAAAYATMDGGASGKVAIVFE